MDTGPWRNDDNPVQKYRFFYLLISLLAMIAVQPLEGILGKFRLILDIVTAVILISAINTVGRKWKEILVGVVLAAPMLVAIWSKYFLVSRRVVITGLLCGSVFFVYVIGVIVGFIASQKWITRDMILGAAVVYLLMALMWSTLYGALEMIRPGAFLMGEGHHPSHQSTFLYFSLVTLTTLGYGDIYPVTSAARTFAILEALIGQFYLVFVVARLVGVHTAQSTAERDAGRCSPTAEEIDNPLSE